MQDRFHFTVGCPHRVSPLAKLRLQYLNDREGGNFEATFAIAAAVSQNETDPLQTMQLQIYLMLSNWALGQVATAEVCHLLRTAASRAVSTGDEAQRQLAAEFVSTEALLFARDCRYKSAHKALQSLLRRCGANHSVMAQYELAHAQVSYAEFGDPERALPHLRDAKSWAADAGDACLQESVVIPLALMRAELGEFEVARQELEEQGLRLNGILPFWDPAEPEVLRTMLRWHSFVHAERTPL